MMMFVKDYLPDIIVGGLLAAAVILVVRRFIRNRKNGISSCGCSCGCGSERQTGVSSGCIGCTQREVCTSAEDD